MLLEGTVIEAMKKRKINWLGHCLRMDCVMRDAIDGMVQDKKERSWIKLLDTIKGK